MTQLIQVEYSKFIKMNTEEEKFSEDIAYEFQYEHDLDIGEHVRLIHGIVGDIYLYFESNIGLHDLRHRVWEVKYGLDEFGVYGLLAIRPVGKKQAVKHEDYDHYYNAWAPGIKDGQNRLLVFNQRMIYGVYRRDADTWLYVRRIHQLQAA